MGKDRYKDAIDALRVARTVDPNSAVAESYTGFAYMRWALARPNHGDRLDMYKVGFPHLDRGMRLDPRYSYVRRHHGNMIAATYVSLKETNRPVNNILAEAMKSLTDAAHLDPTSTRAPVALGMAYLLGGNTWEALQWFDTAIGLSPHYAVAFSGKCMAFRMRREDWRARESASAAASYDSRLRGTPCLNENLNRFWERSSAEF